MRVLSTLFLGCAVLCSFQSSALAQECHWSHTQNISPPDQDDAHDFGAYWPSTWGWSFTYHADYLTITGYMEAACVFCSTSLSKSGTGNGTFVVTRYMACIGPQEDIEATARNEFTCVAHLDESNNVMCAGREKIKATHIQGSNGVMNCECVGGVELSDTELQEGQPSGTITLTLWGTVSVSIQWATSGGDDLSAPFQANDGGAGGRSPETITCFTALQLDVNISDGNGFVDSGWVEIRDPKSELQVWGTCAGYCMNVEPEIMISVGY